MHQRWATETSGTGLATPSLLRMLTATPIAMVSSSWLSCGPWLSTSCAGTISGRSAQARWPWRMTSAECSDGSESARQKRDEATFSKPCARWSMSRPASAIRCTGQGHIRCWQQPVVVWINEPLEDITAKEELLFLKATPTGAIRQHHP